MGLQKTYATNPEVENIPQNQETIPITLDQANEFLLRTASMNGFHKMKKIGYVFHYPKHLKNLIKKDFYRGIKIHYWNICPVDKAYFSPPITI